MDAPEIRDREVIVFTENNMVCFPLPRDSVVFNDTGRNLLVWAIFIQFPCGDVKRVYFDGFPYFSHIGIEKHTPVITEDGDEVKEQKLTDAIKANVGFIAPLDQMAELLDPKRNLSEKDLADASIPSEILEHLRKLSELPNATKRAAMKSKAALN